MTIKRSDSIDYASQCTVCIDYEDGGTKNRLVYERPQIQVPDRPLTEFDLMRMSQYPNDDALTEEARAIFSDMQANGRVGSHAWWARSSLLAALHPLWRWTYSRHGTARARAIDESQRHVGLSGR